MPHINHKTLRNLRLLSLCGVLLCCMKVSAIQFRHIGVSDGLSESSVLAIYQDRLGRIWFGTNEGVNIYDGKSVMSYKYYVNNKQRLEIECEYISGYGDYVFLGAGTALLRYNIRTHEMRCLLSEGFTSLYQKGKRMFVGMDNALYEMRADNYRMRKLCVFANSETSSHTLLDRKGQLWIGSNRGLYLKTKGQKLRTLQHGDPITNLYEDSHGRIWVSTRQHGCYVYEHNKLKHHYTASDNPTWKSFYNIAGREVVQSDRISSNYVRGVAEDDAGNMWLGTFYGLNKLDMSTGKIYIYSNTNNPFSLSHASVFPIYKDTKGTLWIGTYYGGVNYFNPTHDLFNFYSSDVTRSDCLSYPIVGHMVEDKRGDVWICTEGGGLNRLNRKTGEVTHYLAHSSSNSITQNNLKAIAYDAKRDRLYIGTHLGGLSIFDIPSNRFINLNQLHPDYGARYGDQVFDMAIYHNWLLFTTQMDIWKMDLNNLQITPLFPSGRYYGNLYFHIDRKGYVWIPNYDGIWRISLANEQHRHFYAMGTKGLPKLSNSMTDIAEDDQGRIYALIFGAGLYVFNSQQDRFSGYTPHNSNIISDYCYEIEPFRQYLLINTSKGISIFDTRTHKFRNIELGTNFPLEGIHRGCGMMVCRDGLALVGGVNGLASFDLNKTYGHDDSYNLYISRLFVNNHEVMPNDSTKILKEAIYDTRTIYLDHDQSNVTIYFTTNNYLDFYQHPRYEYKLDGYDEHWTETNESRLNYTKISPGRYTLIIRELPGYGQRHTHEARLDIVVRSPFYSTPLAWLIYLLALTAGLYAIYRFKHSQWELRMSLEQEKKDKENIENLNKTKLRFFTNVSHEFRTPLTLLIAKLDSIINDPETPSGVGRKLKSTASNAHHLLGLINELLDFRKIDQGFIKLKVSEGDMVAFVRTIAQSFEEYAQSRKVSFTFQATADSIPCWFDGKQMEKVIYNLLSNAFKYVPSQGGSIELRVEEDREHVYIKVFDNGAGISAEDQRRIFERFYQADGDANKNASMPGTGIGLALVRDIVDLHHGKVSVDSSIGYGSLFTVSLLKGNSHFTAEELVDTPQEVKAVPVPASMPHPDEVAEDATDDGIEPQKYSILIIDDNEELLLTLQSLFSKTYRVLLASDGEEGLRMTRIHKPNLVVSDVMMPGMSGTELCRRIKNDIMLSHIPVILLTAMGSVDQTIDGLKCGADDYISKPFEPRLLVARCNNLIRSRQALRQKFAKENDVDAELLAVNPLDRKFLHDCDAFIQANLQNTDMQIADMAKTLALSRTSFFRKFKDLTGMSPNDYILSYKLKQSTIWLKEHPNEHIGDIAYKLGFSTPRYFSQLFKKKYGCTPNEYRNAAPTDE